MVQIIGYKKRVSEEGKTFFILELQGGIEMALSKSTGRYYATAKKAYISSTFDEQTCLAIIGTEMSGDIERQECEPYDYINKETGEEITLYHRWVYVPEQITMPSQDFKPNFEVFSHNGAMELT